MASEKYDTYLMRALSDKNNIHESLFIMSLKTDKEILSYDAMKIYDVYETNLVNANASLLTQVQSHLDSYKGSKPHSVEFVYLDFRQINMQRKLLSFQDRIKEDYNYPWSFWI